MSRFQTFARCAVVCSAAALTAERTPALIDFCQAAVPAWHDAQPWLNLAEECTAELQISLCALGLSYVARLTYRPKASAALVGDPLEMPLLVWPSGDVVTTRMARGGGLLYRRHWRRQDIHDRRNFGDGLPQRGLGWSGAHRQTR